MSKHRHRPSYAFFLLASSAVTASTALASVTTKPTMDAATLGAALHPVGLTIDSVVVRNGMPGQFGTYANFNLPPVTIQDGIVLSSGDVTDMGPIPGATDPGYDPAWPPFQVNQQMFPDPMSGGTPEFDNYGFKAGHIENFYGCYDVASLEVTFTLDADSQVKFDFIFGSVEYPYWTSAYTDAFLVFLDGTDPQNQITFDAGGSAVQVGSSFAGLETTADQNTAFSNPHGVIHHLTTTTALLEAGTHTLIFEVGDVNDHILDSAAFITHLRTGTGTEGTGESNPCDEDLNGDDSVDGADLGFLLANWGTPTHHEADLNGDDEVDGADLGLLLAHWGPCS